MKIHVYISALCVTTALASTGVAIAAEDAKAGSGKAAAPQEVKSEFLKALTEGKVLFDTRYRYEYVDQDGLSHTANASTIRTRLGYETGKFMGFSALVEGEAIRRLGAEHYNNGFNGKTTYPVVADPEDTAINRLQLSYSGLPDTVATVGRQVINLDNQRFVGSVAWRQNDQTFDAVSVTNKSIKDATLFYAYSDRVNRIFGTDSKTGANTGVWDHNNIQLMNASYTGLPFGKIVGYTYLLDIDDAKALSSATYGARFEGKHALTKEFNGLLNLEYAHQVDYADNPSNYSHNYFSVEPGINYGQWTLKGQYESIGSNGTHSMQFPLATLHAFDGWADKFLTTPAKGLVDANIGLTYVVKSDNTYLNGTKAVLVYHDFSAEKDSTHYGTEWDAMVEQTFEKYYTLGVKFAGYNANALYTDTLKFMPYAQIKF